LWAEVQLWFGQGTPGVLCEKDALRQQLNGGNVGVCVISGESIRFPVFIRLLEHPFPSSPSGRDPFISQRLPNPSPGPSFLHRLKSIDRDFAKMPATNADLEMQPPQREEMVAEPQSGATPQSQV